MNGKGIGPQGLGTSKNNGYTIGEAKGGCKCKGMCQCGKSPMKKLKDLSGDGQVTQKDVLIGRGVIDSPMKQTYKEATSRFKNFDTKNDTIIRGKSIDLPTATKIAKFNSRSMGKAYDEESTFKEADGSYSVMRKYKKNSPTQQTVKDSCYKKVKATYKVFPSAYASGAIAKCRKNK
jgi:hypothetical protein